VAAIAPEGQTLLAELIMSKLTEKQEAFCRAYIECGNASEAYRTAYDAEKMNVASVNKAAQKLLDNPLITPRLEQLRAPNIQKHNITVDSLIAELEEARMAALSAETPQSSAAVSATMSKAKLVGLDKQVIETKDDLAGAINKLIDRLPN
jgi:phage terminase small subunit